MDIEEFRRVLTSFADEPSDVDIRRGKVIAQFRDDIIDASISYGEDGQILIAENDQQYFARSWLINRVAKLPQLADRILASIPALSSPKSPFVTPSGSISADLSSGELQDTEVNNCVKAMLDISSHPTPGATSVIYVTSDAGEGKTTIINRAAREQAQRFKNKEASSLLVPIPLSGRAFLTFDDAVIAALVNKLRFNYFYYDAFINLVRMGAVVPAFDGYEEMLVEGTKGEAVSALGNLVQSLGSSGTVFVAARKAFFEYVSFKTQARLLDAIGDRSAAFSRLELHRWSREQFRDYGRQRGVQDAETIYETVAARLGADHPLLTRAVLVRRLFDVAQDTEDRKELAQLLGNNPHDYFYTFVDAIVKREAAEKWLDRVSGEVMEPLLDASEHHLLLAQIALEMWQSSSTSLRFDVLDVVVELFCEARKKSSRIVRQVKERVRQHSLLSVGSLKGQAVTFDHEDFQDFYLGEGLGQLFARAGRPELQAFLSVNLIPSATVEQSIQYLIRHGASAREVLVNIIAINEMETGFSFCKENCATIALRLVEIIGSELAGVKLSEMHFSHGALCGKTLNNVNFESCTFQPTSTALSSFDNVEFLFCQFERLECDAPSGVKGCQFSDCVIDSMRLLSDDEQSFDPVVIRAWLRKAGAVDNSHVSDELIFPEDDRLKLLEKFLRSFLRSTHVDDAFIRLRMGKVNAPQFFDDVLPPLISAGMLEEVPWKGQGVQHRYKLTIPMSDVNKALERSRGTFEGFLSGLGS